MIRTGKPDLNSGHNLFQAAVLLIVVAVLAAYCTWGSHPDPMMNMKHLGGLTPDQVIARLGSPRWGDPRKPQPNSLDKPWTPDQEAVRGPLTFYYYSRYRWRGFSYEIIFENNHVVRVLIGHK
jgi:hypothetical protein